MDINKTLRNFRKEIDREIATYLDAIIKETAKQDFLMADALRYVKKFVLSGGKRLRPAMMYYGYLAAGGKERKKILQTAVSIELTHAFLLIHDDIIDKDDLRHGINTVSEEYRQLGKKYFPKKDWRHFGDAIAIIIGDMVGAIGSRIIFNSGFDTELVFQALTKLQEIVSVTVIGEAKDVYIEYSGQATEKEVLRMYEYKTAKYTIEGPLHLGAILAGADEKIRGAFTEYAIPLGIAFQIQDDILGIFGSKEKIGKPIDSDIREGKRTILVVKAEEWGNREQKNILKNILGKSDLSVEEIKKFQNVIIETGALEYAKELARKLIAKSQKALSGLKTCLPAGRVEKEAHDFLEGVAEYMIKREL